MARSGKKEQKAEVELGSEREVIKNARDSMKWFMELPATKKNKQTGEQTQVVYHGRKLTNMDSIVIALANEGRTNPSAAMTALTLSGALATKEEMDEEKEKQREKRYREHRAAVERNARCIKTQMQKDGIYTPALLSSVKSAADMLADIEALEKEMATEPQMYHTLSREGADRVDFHPGRRQLFVMKGQAANMLSRIYLAAARFVGNASDSDGFDDFQQKIMAAINEE